MAPPTRSTVGVRRPARRRITCPIRHVHPAVPKSTSSSRWSGEIGLCRNFRRTPATRMEPRWRSMTPDRLPAHLATAQPSAQFCRTIYSLFTLYKRAPDRYVLQWNGRGLRLHVLNTFMRFLLHGLILRSLDGNVVQLSSHLLRHSFATEMADLNTPVEVIAKLLHQRDLTVTKYYARPTPTKVMSAAEMIFVDRIDLGAEGRRSPDEIGRMLKEAEGKVGALTEVFGGTCVVANMCPAKFVCVGCAGNAPDPAKRYQIDQKQAWAEQQLLYARREKLVAEERQMKQLIAEIGRAHV